MKKQKRLNSQDCLKSTLILQPKLDEHVSVAKNCVLDGLLKFEISRV